MSELLLDAAGRRRSPATLPEFHAGRPPRNKGMRYPADPPTIEEIVTVMRHAGDGVHGRRLRGLIVVLWRAGLRICEALALAEADLDPRRGSLLVRRGKGGRRREVGMDDWAWEQLEPWLQARVELPVGPLFCVVNGADARAAVGGRRRPHRAAPRRPRGRRAATLRATPAAPRARRRDGPRGRAADRHPAPARSHQPRHHLGLPPGHRQHRDHRRGPLTPRADGPRPQLAASLKAQRDRRRGNRDFLAAGPRADRQPGTRWRAARRVLHSSRRSDARGVSGLLRSRKEHSRSDMAELRKSVDSAASARAKRCARNAPFARGGVSTALLVVVPSRCAWMRAYETLVSQRSSGAASVARGWALLGVRPLL